MNIYLIVSIIYTIFTVSLSAIEIKTGVDIDQVNQAMQKGGYTESALSMVSKNRNYGLKFWSLGEGSLIVAYSKQTNKIESLEYYFCDERPKGSRKTFYFTVKSYNTENGSMELQLKVLKNKKGKAKPSPQLNDK